MRFTEFEHITHCSTTSCFIIFCNWNIGGRRKQGQRALKYTSQQRLVALYLFVLNKHTTGIQKS